MKLEKAASEGVIKKNTCIVGIGNPLRSDDGVGSYICQLLDEKKLSGVCFITTQQLDIGIAEELSKFDNVIFVDASPEEDNISFRPIYTEHHYPSSSSHQVNIGMLASLSMQLFNTHTRFYICAIGAANFEMGNGLSEKTLGNALAAVSLLTDWILSND